MEVRQARQAEVSLYIGIAVDINMPTKPKDRKILVRVTDDMHGLLQSMADKENVSVPEITRQACTILMKATARGPLSGLSQKSPGAER